MFNVEDRNDEIFYYYIKFCLKVWIVRKKIDIIFFVYEENLFIRYIVYILCYML